MYSIVYERPLGETGDENYPAYGLGGLDGTSDFYTRRAECPTGIATISGPNFPKERTESCLDWTGKSPDEVAQTIAEVNRNATIEVVTDCDMQALARLLLPTVINLPEKPDGIRLHFTSWRGGIYKAEVHTT